MYSMEQLRLVAKFMEEIGWENIDLPTVLERVKEITGGESMLNSTEPNNQTTEQPVTANPAVSPGMMPQPQSPLMR